jgi:hypothetical protein
MKTIKGLLKSGLLTFAIMGIIMAYDFYTKTELDYPLFMDDKHMLAVMMYNRINQAITCLISSGVALVLLLQIRK